MAAFTAALGILAFIALSGCLAQDEEPPQQLPTVEKGECSEPNPTNYDRCMTVNFNDGSDEDVIGLHYVDGKEDNMRGKLVHGGGSVTVTFEEEDVACFTISKSPTRMYMFTVNLRTGETRDPELLPPGRRLTYVRPPPSNELPSEEQRVETRAASFPPQGFQMKFYVFYDKAFRRKFGNRSRETIDKVFAHVNNLFSHSSLNTTITTVVIRKTNWAKEAPATPENLYAVVKNIWRSNYPDANAYLLLTVDDGDDNLGIGYFSSTCGKKYYRATIVEYEANALVTAQSIVHEIGHNLGMDHDFNEIEKNGTYYYQKKKSSKGKMCTNSGGYMDYLHRKNKWSDCSVEEFAKYFRDHQPYCLEEIADN